MMESNALSPSLDNADTKVSFRKRSSDPTTRQYRRRSPVGGSCSSDESPKQEGSSTPIHSRKDPVRQSDTWRRKDNEKDLDRDSGKNHHGRSGDVYRPSDHQSSRSSYDYHRQDNYSRRDKFTNEEERHYSKPSSHSGRESRSCNHSENKNYKSGPYSRGDDKYSRDRSDGSGHRSMVKDRDERRDNQRLDCRSGRSPGYEDSGEPRNGSDSQRDRTGHRLKETSKGETKELDCQKYAKEDKAIFNEQETGRRGNWYDKQSREQFKEKSVLNIENEDSPAKRRKPFSLSTHNGKDEDEGKSSKQAQEPAAKINSEQAPAIGCTAADVDAAKVAAMRAAELVNKNLIGTGYMSADQKKKLLWGNKKSTMAEATGHPWDTVTFSDREQQEKFNKLMGLKGEVKADHRPHNQESGGLHSEKQKEVQLDLEKQYIAGLRRRDGRTVGLGL